MKERLFFGITGFLLGVLLTSLTQSVSSFLTREKSSSRNTGNPMQTMNHSDMSMQSMTTSLSQKTGDAFDALFLEEMIVHHQGAIDMANLASTSAKHEEIKNLSHEIIRAQENEITQMRMWQKMWGYDNE